MLKGIYAFVMKRIDALSKRIEKAQSSAEKANSAAETAQAAAETAQQAASAANTNANRKVSSVNGKTGAVEIAASDVGAISSADGSVQNAHLADSSVTTDKLAEAERMTSANIVSALGYEPEKVSNIELILDTTTGGTQTTILTQDGDGNALSLRLAYVLMDYAESMSQNIWIGPLSWRWVKKEQSGEKSSLTEISHIGGKFWRVLSLGKTLTEEKGDVDSCTGGYVLSTSDTLSQIAIYFSTSMPENTRIRIYGIRA